MTRCEFCGTRAPVTAVVFRQNTGMLVFRQTRTWEGHACRDCGKAIFRRATLHTALLGWWGTISFFLTPVLLVLNVVHLTKVLRLPTAEDGRRTELEGHEAYARNLLATKDRGTVAEVLQRESGASRSEVEAFLDQLVAARAA